MQSLQQLRNLLDHVPERLSRISTEKVDAKPAPSKWSPKEELGHLLDSAANNHQRIVRTQLEDKPKMPGYDGDKWVALHRYQDRPWPDLIALWRALNMQLLVAVEAARDAAWTRTCTIGDSQPLTLKFVFEDYLDHMIHHLQHIGINVNDLK
ncbi:MAG: DinB family protein [Terriglobales bacterium]